MGVQFLTFLRRKFVVSEYRKISLGSPLEFPKVLVSQNINYKRGGRLSRLSMKIVLSHNRNFRKGILLSIRTFLFSRYIWTRGKWGVIKILCKKFVVLQYQNITSETILSFRKFLLSKCFSKKSASRSSVKTLLSHNINKFEREPIDIEKCSGIETFHGWEKRELSWCSVESLLSHYTKKNRRVTLLSFKKFLLSKSFMDKRRGVIKIFYRGFIVLQYQKDSKANPSEIENISVFEKFFKYDCWGWVFTIVRQKFVVSQYQKNGKWTLQRVRGFLLSKMFMDKRRGSYHDFPTEVCGFTVPRNSVGCPFWAWENLRCRENSWKGEGDYQVPPSKIRYLTVSKNFEGGPFLEWNVLVSKISMDKRRGSFHDVPSKNCCLTIPEKFLGEHFWLLENFWNRKILKIGEVGEFHVFPWKTFCITQPKHFVVEPYWVSEIFCNRKVFGWEEGGYHVCFVEILLSYITKKVPTGTLLSFRKVLLSKSYLDRSAGGGFSRSSSKNCCLTVSQKLEGEPCREWEKFWYRKFFG